MILSLHWKQLRTPKRASFQWQEITTCLFIFPVIEISENTNTVDLLSNEILNGKLYKTTKLEEAPSELKPTNHMQLKICYQTDENDIETEIMLTNEKCSYKVPQYKENCESHSSLSSQLSQVNSSMAWMKVQISTDSCGYPTTFCEQFSILLCRMIKQISRNRQGENLYT